jgi:hypothetical protein
MTGQEQVTPPEVTSSECEHRTLNTHPILDEIGGFWTELNTYCPRCGEKL